MRVVLNHGEMATAQSLASMRRCVNEVRGVVDRRRDNRCQALTLDLLGTVSEIAFCKAFGAYPDLSVEPRSGGADVILNGRRWDIKATSRPAGRLLATPGKRRGDADFYALAVVSENVVDLVGWVPASVLLCEATLVDLGHGPTHAVDQSVLRPFPADAGGRF